MAFQFDSTNNRTLETVQRLHGVQWFDQINDALAILDPKLRFGGVAYKQRKLRHYLRDLPTRFLYRMVGSLSHVGVAQATKEMRQLAVALEVELDVRAGRILLDLETGKYHVPSWYKPNGTVTLNIADLGQE